MKVTIIGAGNMGRGIGTRVLAGGNDVQIVDRDPEEARKLANELGQGATAGEPGGALEGDVVVLAVWYGSERDVIRDYADQLAGKTVVEITNPVDLETFDGLATPAGMSAAEEAAKLLPEDTPIVKAFNTTFAGTLVAGEVDGEPLDVLVAGDDEEAKRTVMELVEAGGLRPIDAGPLRRARELEALGFLHMKLQEPLAAGYGSAVKVLT